MAINIRNNRQGNLFEKNFKRKIIQKESYLTSAVVYIHSNPVHYNLTNEFRNYPYSSYKILVTEEKTNLKRKDVIGWFGSKKAFIEFHDNMIGSKFSDVFLIE